MASSIASYSTDDPESIRPKCFECNAPAICKALCSRTSPKGHITLCLGCTTNRWCPLCKLNRKTDHQFDQEDFKPLAVNVFSLSRKSASEENDILDEVKEEEEEAEEAEKEPSRLTPRKYQQEAFRHVCEQNTIVNLDTGLGKTLVAIMSIDHFYRKFPGKKILLCVPTVALAKQHCKVIQEQTTVKDLQVLEVTGKTSGSSSDEWWKEQSKNYHVFVGTGQIFKQALVDRAFLRLENLSLLVFDECHHAVGSHPFVAIMQDPQQWRDRADNQPRILGLTASYLHGRSADFLGRRKKLEANLRSKIWSSTPDDIRPYLRELSHTNISYDQDGPDVRDLQEKCGKSLDKMLKAYSSSEESPLWNHKNDLEKLQGKADRCFSEAGFDGWKAFLKAKVLPAVRGRLQSLQHDPHHLMQAEAEWNAMRPTEKQIPEKLNELILLLKDFFSDASQKQNKCIVFVEQVDDTYPLSVSINCCMKRMLSGYVSGTQSMTQAQQQEALNHFKDGKAPILVATQAIEEGIDVPSCNLVIRYHSFHNVKSHIQGSGRARKDAQIFYFENDWEEEEKQADLMRETARLQLEPTPLEQKASKYPVFLHPNTEAQVDAYNCLAILREYVQKTAKGQWKGDCLFKRAEGVITECCAPVVDSAGKTGEIKIIESEVAAYWQKVAGSSIPSITDFTNLLDSERKRKWSMEEQMQHRFAMVAVERLSQEGHIDDRNLPSEQAIQGNFQSAHDSFTKLISNRVPAAHTLPPFEGETPGGPSGELSFDPAWPPGSPGLEVPRAASPSWSRNNWEGSGWKARDWRQWDERDDWSWKEQPPPRAAKLKADGEVVLTEEKPSKSKLNEFLAKYAGNLQKGDLHFNTVPAPAKPGTQNFVSTLLLKNLHGLPGEGMTFAGEPKSNKQDAEHSASAAALEHLSGLPGVVSDTTATAALSEPSVKITNPKGTLQEIIAKRTKRQTPEDFCYTPTQVEGGYIIRLQLGAQALGGTEGRHFDSSTFSCKTKKSIKAAEEEAATKALQFMNYGSSVSKGSSSPAPVFETACRSDVSEVSVREEDSKGEDKDNHEKEKTPEIPEEKPEGKPEDTVKVCLVRPDGQEKSMTLHKALSIQELIQKHRPSSLKEDEVEVVGPGDMVLEPDFTLLDCTMVLDTDEEVPRFAFRKLEE